jgi:hypothetical protein
VYEDIRSTVTAEEAVSFCIVKPLYGASILCHFALLVGFLILRRIVGLDLSH